jgi:hypothetical protein
MIRPAALGYEVVHQSKAFCVSMPINPPATAIIQEVDPGSNVS